MFTATLINPINSLRVDKAIQSSYINRDILTWMQEHGQTSNIRKEFTQEDNSDMYKTFDIVSRTLDKYSKESI